MESRIGTFVDLLATYYRQEHLTDFDASHLHISARYLTRLVKRITGQNVTDFIFEMLYSVARTLSATLQPSVQEIATLLHLSHQSSSGKFFKRKAGFSPADFRKNRR